LGDRTADVVNLVVSGQKYLDYVTMMIMTMIDLLSNSSVSITRLTATRA